MKSDWLFPELDSLEIENISQDIGIDKNIVSILYSRGIKTSNEITEFLYPELNNLHSPFLLDGIYDAVSRLKTAIKNGEKIAIFGDSDLDGITSLTIIHSVLNRAGCNAIIRYPKAKESYGLTCNIIDEFIKEKVNLVITVDSGIRDVEEINYGKKNGIDFVITDHHEQGKSLPDAIIINPKKNNCLYPFKELAGVGVAFKFAHAFLFSFTSIYNVNFVLIYKKNHLYTIKSVKNGVSTDEFIIEKDDLINTITTFIKTTDQVVLLNIESLELESILKSIYSNIIITDIRKIASSFNKTNYSDFNQMINMLSLEFNINNKNIKSEFELYYKIFKELQARSLKKIISILSEYIVLVAIGTIADIMPLHGENRQFVKYGLSLMNNKKGHIGILSIINKSSTTSKTISWDIAPLLNAPGRMGETDLTVNFFLEKDNSKTELILKKIQKINKERKKLVLEIIGKIASEKTNIIIDDKIFFYMHDEISEGIAGLIANRLVDDYKKPVVIATGTDMNGIFKGSARSTANFDFFNYTADFHHLFERVGGHAQAFGFTADIKNIKEIADRLNNSIVDKFISNKSFKLNAFIDLKEINSGFIKNLSILEPFGKGNDEPLFLSNNIRIENFSTFGNQENHGKYIINKSLHAIGWNMSDIMSFFYNSKKDIDLIFKLENNEYMGKLYPRLIIIDIDFSD